MGQGRTASVPGLGGDPGGTRDLLVAAFRSGETERLSREVGFDVAVITVVTDPASHAEVLSDTFHACWRPRPGWIRPFDFFDVDARTVVYSQLHFDPRWMGSSVVPPGVSFRGGGLGLTVSAGTSRRVVAQALGLAMADRRFDLVAQQPQEVRRRHRSGRRLDVAPRYSLDPRFYGDLPKLANDLFAFRPRDLAWVVDCAVRTCLFLGLQANLRPLAAELRECSDAESDA